MNAVVSEVGAALSGIAPHVLVGVILVLALAGLIKGTLGFGLPLVAISLLSNVVEIHLALALVTLPIVLSNLWLGLQGGDFPGTLRKYWMVVLAIGVGIFAGSRVLVGIDKNLLMFLLGTVIIVFALAEQFNSGAGLVIPPHAERRWGIAAGLVAGLMGGLSTAYGPPLIMYLTALRLPKEVYIGTLGVIWFFASIFLVAAFSSVKILTPYTAVLSAFSVIPVFIGMALGKRLRARIDQHLFQRLTLIALVILALNLLRRGLWG
jgi:uncharacterized membrane protein YfcA